MKRRSFLELSAAGLSSVAISSVMGGFSAFRDDKQISGSLDFIWWKFGGKKYSSIIEAKSSFFEFGLNPRLTYQRYDFCKELTRACHKLDGDRAGQTIALCLSGGVDSELVALEMTKLGIPFEGYFLDIWGINRDVLDQYIVPLSRSLNFKLNVVRVERDYFLEEFLKKAFCIIGCEFPTYLALTYLFEKIPEDQFIVVGDGDLETKGEAYATLNKRIMGKYLSQKGTWFPVLTSEVAYWVWAKYKNRPGSFYFFSSTPELYVSAMTDPNFFNNNGIIDNKEFIYEYYPEIKRRPKTTNWESDPQENKIIRDKVKEVARQVGLENLWTPLIGTAFMAEDIFYDFPIKT